MHAQREAIESMGTRVIPVTLELTQDQYRKLEHKRAEANMTVTEVIEDMVKFILEEYDEYWDFF